MYDHSETVLQKLTTETLVHVASFLDLASIVQFSMAGKPFSHLIKDERLFKQLNKRDFRVSEKSSAQTWLDMYKQLNDTDVVMADATISSEPSTAAAAAAPTESTTQAPASDTATQQPTESTTTTTTDIAPATAQVDTQEAATDACPHFEPLTEFARQVKKILFKSEEAYLCDLCSNHPAAYLSMHPDDHTGGSISCQVCIMDTYFFCVACLSCLTTTTQQPLEGQPQQAQYPIQLELVTGDIYCFKCHPGKPRKVSEWHGHRVCYLVCLMDMPLYY